MRKMVGQKNISNFSTYVQINKYIILNEKFPNFELEEH